MSLYQAGDFSAFETLYLRHSGRVFEYLKKKVAVDRAQDLLQDTFEKLHKSRDKYNPQYPFLPWLFTVSRNVLFDSFKQAESKLASSSSSSVGLLENLAAEAHGNSPFNISQVLERLPHSQRRALELRYLQDWSFEKIASDMKTSEENARQLISRGIKKIRLALKWKGNIE